MYVFVDKLFNISLPRVRDFKGVSRNSFDGRGNYSMGIKEQLIFPEINYDQVDMIKGMNSYSPQRPRPTRKLRLCLNCSACRLRNRNRRETWLKHLSRLNSRENLNIRLVHIPDADCAEDLMLY